ncbi:MAG: acyl-CoA dehydrogenase family protein [Xanthomonadales bacterium]|nr:acyl-CoA dehydrogenase family protein [Xanthomonadales bacterium]
MDFSLSDRCEQTLAQAREFLTSRVEPVEREYLETLRSADSPWFVPPIVDELKAEARAAGLWNLFLPDKELGAGLSVAEYAPIAELTGRSVLAPEVFNCNAPDTGNMEVLWKYGSEAQKREWLEPLLAGEVRSAFCMTEPEVASSDATNMAATARLEGDEVVVNGRKWWSTGIGHPRCSVVIFMGLTDEEADRHRQHSMVLVPMDTPGVKVERMLPVFGEYDAPYGHGEVSFDNVRLPADAIIGGPGRGFEIAQGRLGPGRIHHCMRLIGMAERALELAVSRAVERTAFGKPLARLGGNLERIAEARLAIEQARLLTMKAAWMIDRAGVKAAMSEISQIKIVAPRVAQNVVDMAIQMHGAGGLCDDFPLAGMFISARSLRIADGPDEVHRHLVGKLELARHRGRS